MPRVVCPVCGGAHPKWECRSPRKEVVPDRKPRAEAGTDNATAPVKAAGAEPYHLTQSDQRIMGRALRKSVQILQPDLQSMTLDELRPYFNEWMRRKMQARRAEKKG